MNSGHANQAAIRLLLWSVVALGGFFAAAWIGYHLGGVILAFHKVFIVLWAFFLVAVLYLFRDPDPVEPADVNAIVSPAHGKVDVVEETVESEFMQEACKRISIRVSLLNVQVQYAPAPGTVAHLRHQAALKQDHTGEPENLWIGVDVAGRPNTRLAVRLVAGMWGRRIVSWVKRNDVVPRGARLGMMRPSRRVDLYLPRAVKLQVNAGDEVVGGQSVVARFE
jgi:phosphatidylserine decarboxylase